MQLTVEDLWRDLVALRSELLEVKIEHLEVLARLKQQPTLHTCVPTSDQDIALALAKARRELAQIGASRADMIQKAVRPSV